MSAALEQRTLNIERRTPSAVEPPALPWRARLGGPARRWYVRLLWMMAGWAGLLAYANFILGRWQTAGACAIFGAAAISAALHWEGGKR